MERHFLYAAVWAFGGHLSPSHQILFDYWLRSKCRKELDEELCIPDAGNVSSLSTCVKCVSVCVSVWCNGGHSEPALPTYINYANPS